MQKRIRHVVSACVVVGVLGTGTAAAQPYLAPIVASTGTVVIVVVPSAPVNPWFGLGYAWGFNTPTPGERTSGALLHELRQRRRQRAAAHAARMECWGRQRAAEGRWHAFWNEQQGITMERIEQTQQALKPERRALRKRLVEEGMDFWEARRQSRCAYDAWIDKVIDEERERREAAKGAAGLVNPYEMQCGR